MRQFVTLLRRHKYLRYIEDVRAALTPWHLANIYSKSPISLYDFMEKFMPWSDRAKPHKQSQEDMRTMVFALNALLGGEVVIN